MQLIGLGHETHYHERRSQTLKLGRGAFTQMLERYRGKLRKAALAPQAPGASPNRRGPVPRHYRLEPPYLSARLRSTVAPGASQR